MTVRADSGDVYAAWKGAASDPGIYWSIAKAVSASGIEWATQRIVQGVGTTAGPALACFKNIVYLAWKGAANDTRIYWSRCVNGIDWEPQQPLPMGRTGSAPALGATDSALYVAWKGEGPSNEIYWAKSTDGKTWAVPSGGLPTTPPIPGLPTPKLPPPTLTPIHGIGSSDTPALAGLGDVLYMAWKGAADDATIWWSRCADGFSWAPQQQIPSVWTSCGPALAASRPVTSTAAPVVLTLAWKGSGTDTTIWCSSLADVTSNNWKPQQQIPGIFTSTRPALSAPSPHLDPRTAVLAWKAPEADVKIWTGPCSVVRPAVKHIFVLMLENRSFDHMLGFSGITGADAATGKPTAINGLKGTESNSFNGKTYTVQRGAANIMQHDPPHEFENVVTQLCGPGAAYPSGGAYPQVNNSGFAAAYGSTVHGDPSDVMKCYSPEQLPVLTALAREFVVCDNWYASIPGPTFPNRMFAHAASSGGLDHSPSDWEIFKWEELSAFDFKHGNIFNALGAAKLKYRIYAGDDFPMVGALHTETAVQGQPYSQITYNIFGIDNFAKDLSANTFDCQYVFIEPSYDVLNQYKDGTSQHPLGDVTRGEALIKSVYEAIRNSPVWENSVLIITWDEHGGFYDHAVAGSQEHAVAPGDTAPNSEHNQHGFTFQQFGPRVPAVVISPLIPRNLIDHRIYDHSSIPATVERTFNVAPLTNRDKIANSVNTLATLPVPRTDAPARLPSPAIGDLISNPLTRPAILDGPIVRPLDPVNEGNLPVFLYSAMRQDLQMSAPEQRPAIIARARAIKTRAQAMEYMKEVQLKLRARPLAAMA